ncbi:MAG: isoleucine--tRNA ligase [Solirubrobacterales bacterium]
MAAPSDPTRFRPVESGQAFPALEERVLERWREQDLFRRSLEQRRDAPVWSFFEGPPTANGRPGSHHVLSRVFKDIYPRYRTMRGFRVPRKGGWDCHGLPVELEVEKEIGISSKEEIEEFGIAEFNERCRASVVRYVSDWNRLTERIGFWLDLDDPYWTLDNDYIESVWWALGRLWEDGRLYEGHKVVPYCPRCGTALSSHEVALGYRDVEDPSAYVRLPIDGDPGSSPLQAGDALVVWTTTPWTLMANAAVAAGPEITYARVRHDDEVLVLAEALVERVLGEQAEILDRFSGEQLTGVRYRPPFDYVTDFGPKSHSVLPAAFVTTDDGTGLVHTALAFGEDDFRFGEQHGLTLQNPVRLDGTYDERTGPWAGRFVKDADADIVADLDGRGLLLRSERYEHAYPHCWRCETPLLYYAKSSWYIRTTEVRDEMLAGNQEISWYPEHIRDGRFGRWLENNVDWALSRDRYWGTPLPIWECASAECDHRECVGSRERLRELGGEVPEDLHRPHIDDVELDCAKCGGTMRRVAPVIDTWFDSGAMPFAQHHYPFENTELFDERHPADFICEAIDQTRGWFYTLHAESTLLFGGPAYRNCVCLGLILDPEGQKMSKSRGNIVAPQEVLDRHGADALRWYYLTAQQPWTGYRFSTDAVGESVRRFLLTLWNTYAFYVLYANASEATDPPSVADRDPLDRWLLARLQGTVAVVTERLDDYDSTTAGREIAEAVDELSNWYVRLSRRRFWEGDPGALATLREALTTLSELLAPFIPFVADEIWTNLVGGADGAFPDDRDSVHLADFPEPDEALADADLQAEMGTVQTTVELGRAARAAAGVKNRQPLRSAVIVASDTERQAIEGLADLVRAELNVKALEFVSDEAELASYEVKPNYRALGPRFGAEMPQVAAAIEALDPDAVANAVRGGAPVGVSIGGKDHQLTAEDVTLVMAPLPGYEVSAEAGHAVALATELDDDLRVEGLAREIVHAIQGTRRDEGLEITDRIALSLGGAPDLLEAARTHADTIATETLATTLAYDATDGATTTIEGSTLHIAVTKSG